MEPREFSRWADRPQTTPESIRHLQADEVFVFGSNLAGEHLGGAAKAAYEHFGAIWGKGIGIQGQSYAIPTMHGGPESIQPYVDEFIQFARSHKELYFYVTRIGCGIAGFKTEQIAPLFKEAMGEGNICLPASFVEVLDRLYPAPKTKVFHVIILDRSGSMTDIRGAAINGFNETLASIKSDAREFGKTQEQYISLVTFCSCSLNYIYDKTPALEAKPLAWDDYVPCCCTPLYDAMGVTLTNMRDFVKKQECAVGMVTIITDGLENDSTQYTGPMVQKLIEAMKEEGWTFTFMGANQDVTQIRFDLSIDHVVCFEADDEGIQDTMRTDANIRRRVNEQLNAPGCNMRFRKAKNSERAEMMQTLYAEAFNEAQLLNDKSTHKAPKGKQGKK